MQFPNSPLHVVSLTGLLQMQKTIKETFNLGEVPREAYYIGLAGVLPYLATSLTTVYLAWDINHASTTGHGLLLTGQNAELLLNFIEPLQVGYGAVVCPSNDPSLCCCRPVTMGEQ
jgi:hypothetical protein